MLPKLITSISNIYFIIPKTRFPIPAPLRVTFEAVFFNDDVLFTVADETFIQHLAWLVAGVDGVIVQNCHLGRLTGF